MKRSDLQSHLTQTFGISGSEFDRLYEEFVAFFDVTLEAFVQRRHLELRKTGKRNDEIYSILLNEIDTMRFAVGDLSERQIRRLIYG